MVFPFLPVRKLWLMGFGQEPIASEGKTLKVNLDDSL